MLWAFIAALSLAGCAETGPILLSVTYGPPEAPSKPSQHITVGVSPLADGRGVPASVLGKETVSSGLENDLVTQGTVADLVTSKLKEAFAARGIAVKDVPAWNRTEETVPAGGYDLLVSGEIISFRVESVSVPFKTSLKTLVQLKIVAADPAQKKIVRVLDVNSRLEQEVLYSREKLNEALSEALSSALDQIFQDDVLRKRFALPDKS